jgi:hypothetical protein
MVDAAMGARLNAYAIADNYTIGMINTLLVQCITLKFIVPLFMLHTVGGALAVEHVKQTEREKR